MYANYGRDEDFAQLKKLGVNCTGKIVIIRYGKVARSSKVSAKVELPSRVQPSGCSNKTMKTADNASPLPSEKRHLYDIVNFSKMKTRILNKLRLQYFNKILPVYKMQQGLYLKLDSFKINTSWSSL